jgi:hypothetical protein
MKTVKTQKDASRERSNQKEEEIREEEIRRNLCLNLFGALRVLCGKPGLADC